MDTDIWQGKTVKGQGQQCEPKALIGNLTAVTKHMTYHYALCDCPYHAIETFVTYSDTI